MLHGALNRRHAELMLQGVWHVSRILRVSSFLAQREVVLIVVKLHETIVVVSSAVFGNPVKIQTLLHYF